MRVTTTRTTYRRMAIAGLIAATTLAGCVQFGTGRGKPFPEEDHHDEIVDETGDREGLEGSEIPSDVGPESDAPIEDASSTEG